MKELKELQDFLHFLNQKPELLAIGLFVTILTGITGVAAIFLPPIGAAIVGTLVLLFIISAFFKDRKKCKTPDLLNQNDNEIKPKPKQPKRKKFKTLLPYLPDLGTQESALSQAIQSWKKWDENNKHRPLIFLMCGSADDDGDDNELQTRWEKYLSALLSKQQNLEPEKIYLSNLNTPLTIKRFRETKSFYTEASLHNTIWEKLRDCFLSSYSGHDLKNDVAKTLANKRGPIFLYAIINTTKWHNQKRTIEQFCQEFIDFWYDDANEGLVKRVEQQQPIIIGLFFRYDSKTRNPLKKKCPKSLFSEKKNDLLKFQQKYQHAEVYQLPVLSGIEKEHVTDDWIEHYRKEIKRCRPDIGELKDEIEALYKGKDTIPLKILGRQLRQLLER